MISINISKEYTETPGSRYKDDGPFSGQEFREKFLEEHFRDEKSDYKVKIIFDGTEGYATSFLEESFGGLARLYGIKRCLSRLEFISKEEPLLPEEIKHYIENSNE